MTIANLETIIDMQSWCRTWPPNGSRHIRAKPQLHKKPRSLQKFLEPERKPRVIYTDNSWEFDKACEDLSWNHCTSTPHRSETHGIAKKWERAREKSAKFWAVRRRGLRRSAQILDASTKLLNTTHHTTPHNTTQQPQHKTGLA